MIDHGWQARIVEDAAGFVRGQERLVLWRPMSDGRVEYVAEAPVTMYMGSGVTSDGPPAGLLLPAGVREALTSYLLPDGNQGGTRRLEEALKVERDRVDHFLGAVLDRGLVARERARDPRDEPF